MNSKLLDIEIDYGNVCNLNCDYCILKMRNDKRDKARVSLPDIAKFIIKYYMENKFKHVRLRFTGCEPMLVVKDLVYISETLYQIGILANLNIVTNATTFDPDSLAKLKNVCGNIRLTVSIDNANNTYQSHRKYKTGKPVLTADILANTKDIEDLLETRATFSSVVTDQTYDDLVKQIKFFKDRNRVNLLQFDNNIVNSIDKNSQLAQFVKQHKENDCSLECIQVDSHSRLCIDFYGDVFKCRAHKTAGFSPIINIRDYTGGKIIPNLDEVKDFYNKHKDKYIENYCPLLILKTISKV